MWRLKNEIGNGNRSRRWENNERKDSNGEKGSRMTALGIHAICMTKVSGV